MMSDDDFWTKSSQVGFDFSENTWDQYAIELPKLSAAIRNNTSTSGDLEQFHSKGFGEYVQTDITPIDSPLNVSSESISKNFKRASLIEKEILKDKPTPEQTVFKIITGQEFSLESHKSKNEKLALLDAAIKSHDGNAILAIVLFLKRTLKKHLFQFEILKRPEAVNHYLAYLEADNEYDELDNMYVMLNKFEAAAILKYKLAIRVSHPENKIKRLENCLNTHFQFGSVKSLYTDAIAEYIRLLRRQLPIDEDDTRQERENSNELFITHPREQNLTDMSVISTLLYCCTYHYYLPENHFASPIAIKKEHRLTNKQYMWTTLTALSKIHWWQEIHNVFANKNWLGNVKMKCCIGFANAVPLMAKYGAPEDILIKYIGLVEDVEERLSLAKRFKFHSLILEILRNTRDRQGLLTYKSETNPKSVEFIEVEELLLGSNIKWKN